MEDCLLEENNIYNLKLERIVFKYLTFYGGVKKQIFNVIVALLCIDRV